LAGKAGLKNDVSIARILPENGFVEVTVPPQKNIINYFNFFSTKM
jgi:hypothetical protein